MNTIEKALIHALFLHLYHNEMTGEINDDDQEVFEYKGKTMAVIPNHPSQADFEELSLGS